MSLSHTGVVHNHCWGSMAAC